MPRVTVFGSGIIKLGSNDYIFAEKLGEALAGEGFSLATGGYAGAMEGVLRGAAKHDVIRVGVTTEFYENRPANEYVTEEIKMPSYFDRLNKLIEIGDAYVILPGHTGTLLEYSAVWAMKERDPENNKLIICVGEKWHDIACLLGKGNDFVVESKALIHFTSDIDEIIRLVKESFER